MEEYDYKLRTNNPAFIAKTISALVQAIRDKMQPPPEGPESTSSKHEITEFKYLKEKCICVDPLISTTASLGLLELVKSNTIQISRTMSDLVAMIPLAKNHSGIIMSVTQLLITDLEAKCSSDEAYYECPFNLIAPQHPLISVLLQDPNAWEDVLSCIASKHHYDVKAVVAPHLNKLFKPLYLYVLCDPFLKLPQSCRAKFFDFLVNCEPCDLNLLSNIIGWLQISSNGALPYTSAVITDLMKSQSARPDTDFQEFLLLWLTSVLYELCLNNRNIAEVVACISKEVDELKLGCASVLLFTLANCIRIISAAHLEDLLILSLKLLKSNSVNAFAALSLKASLLNWSINPSFVTERSAGLMQALYSCVQDNDDDDAVETEMLKRNEHVLLYQNTNQSVHLAIELCALSESWGKSDDLILNWLADIPLPHPHQPPIKFLQTFLLGLFLYEPREKVALTSLDLLIKHADGNKNLTSDILTLVLHRLSNPMASPKFQLRLLKALPKMGALKENLQLIISTLKAISRSSMVLRTLALGLFYELWLTESRCYPYLQSLLTEEGKVQDEEFNIAKARILKEFCIKRPELYGTELAAHLSKILNQCKNDSGLASALALEGLKYLCVRGVIDIVTAWDSLASTFNNEKRTVVIISFCDLISEVPNLPMESTKYQQTVGEVVSKLWWYTTSCEDLEVIESAYKSLSAFSLADLSAEFPHIYQQGVQPKNEKVSVFTNYELIPGKWWLVLLQNGNRAAISHAADLIISLASKEVSEYGRGIYTVPANRGEPHNYNVLPESSIIRAVTAYIKQQTRELDAEVDVMCLKILAHEYAKPLPPHDWCFLQELVHEPHFRSYCITLASKQVVLSGTARRFVENFIMAVTHGASNLEDVACVIRNLKHLCNSIQPSIVKPLLENSFRYALSFIENQGDCAFFDELAFQVEDVLKKEDLQESNRNVLAQMVVTHLQSCGESTPVFKKLLKCVPLLPPRYIKECTSLMKKSDGNLKAVKIHCALAKRCSKSPLVWLNDVVDSAGAFETDLTHVWLEIVDVFVALKDHSTAPDWILELIGRIQINLADLQAFGGCIAFMCDVLMLAVTVFSGHHVLLKKAERDSTERKTIRFLFPQALRFLLIQEKWQKQVSQMLEWLYHLINLEKTPEEYEVAFYQALVALRHQVAFKESFKWMKFVGCKRKQNEKCKET